MRARNVKPGYFNNEVLGAAEPLFALTYAGLWCVADCEGRLEDRPGRIHIQINPFRLLPETVRSLDWLAQNGFIVRYEVDGERYIWLPKFTKHQSPHVEEKKKGSKLPAYIEVAPESNQTPTGVAPESNHGTPADSGLPIADGLIADVLKPETQSPISNSQNPDSHIPDSTDESRRAREALKNPKHRKFSDYDISLVAGVSPEVVKAARLAMRASQ